MTAPTTPLAVRAVEHLSFTVSDLDLAERFLVDVLGATVIRRAEYSQPGFGSRVGAAHDATARLVKVAFGETVVEVWEFSAMERPGDAVGRNACPGGFHLGLAVDDVRVAATALEDQPGVTLLGEPERMTDWDGATRWWVYAETEWGLTIELVSTEQVLIPETHRPSGLSAEHICCDINISSDHRETRR